MHFHVCVVDGVFEVVAGETKAETTVAPVQADLRRRILRAFVGRGLIEKSDAKEMLL